jgi:hypothetical protein
VKIAAGQGIIALFLNSSGGGRVFLVDQDNGKVLGSITTQSKIGAVLPSSDTVWVATDDLILTGYDIQTMKRDKLFHLGSRALQMDFTMDSLWLLCERGVDSIKIKQGGI